MVTLTLKLSDEEKRFIRLQAAVQNISMKKFILEKTGYFNKKKGTIWKAMKEIEEGDTTKYDTVDDLIADIEKW